MAAPLLVFLGGGAGAVLRWLVSQAVTGPAGTVAVNVLGSALLALLVHPALGATPGQRLLFGTGALGGFTTYSTFNLDVLTLVHRGRPLAAAGLATLTLVGCLIGGLAGSWLASRWEGHG